MAQRCEIDDSAQTLVALKMLGNKMRLGRVGRRNTVGAFEHQPVSTELRSVGSGALWKMLEAMIGHS